MKNKKNIIITIASIIVIIASIIAIVIYRNSNHLTMIEKRWITDSVSQNKVVNINVINSSYVLGKDGNGVIYSFLDDFKNNYNLNLNEVTFNYGNSVSGVSINAKNTIDNNDTIIYQDHYVLVSKKHEIINDTFDLTGKTISVLASDLSYVSSYITASGVNYVTYSSFEELRNSINEGGYAIVPLHLYLGDILTSNLEIIYHFSDINMYYVLSSTDDELSNILKKYYKTWKDNFTEKYNDELFSLMTKSLNISETEIDAMQSMTYKYGYINNSPYEVISSGNYGGIVAVYLSDFCDFADLDFKFTKYRNFNKFSKAFINDEVDIYFNYYDLTNNYFDTSYGVNEKYYIIANNQNDIAINSINALKGKTVYVDKNSKLYTYISSLKDINIKTYTTEKSLKRLNKTDALIIIDKNIYNYYKSHGLENYSVRYENHLNNIYGFKVKNDNAMYKLLNKYLSIKDNNQIVNKGMYNHEKTVKSGIILSYIAKYFMYFLAIFIIILYFTIKRTKKITVAKKIKKDDKLKFIDQLTLLKNRNYLSENISSWSNNTIYPQAIIVLDLNHIQTINDTKGYEEGDKQIKAAANVLIKTQLDNSDIIRTDGNEFVIYMVGYSQKQVTNYIHKINKEFKKLPYEYGAEFGYYMILDDITTIEDALNEATKQLKSQKDKNEKKN